MKLTFKYPPSPRGKSDPENVYVPIPLMKKLMGLRNSEFKVCMFLIDQTYGQQRREAELTEKEIAAGARVSVRTALKCLKNLEAGGIL